MGIFNNVNIPDARYSQGDKCVYGKRKVVVREYSPAAKKYTVYEDFTALTWVAEEGELQIDTTI